MWQLSGAHGYRAQAGPAVSDMRKYYESGFNTFDLADIYGPAEEITGAYQKQYGPKQGLFFTKVCENAGLICMMEACREPMSVAY